MDRSGGHWAKTSARSEVNCQLTFESGRLSRPRSVLPDSVTSVCFDTVHTRAAVSPTERHSRIPENQSDHRPPQGERGTVRLRFTEVSRTEDQLRVDTYVGQTMLSWFGHGKKPQQNI